MLFADSADELRPEQAMDAPGDDENTGENAKRAYAFFNHLMDSPLPNDARWTSRPSLDGEGEFTLLEPAPALGQEPELQLAPPWSTAGRRLHRPNGVASAFGRFTRAWSTRSSRLIPR